MKSLIAALLFGLAVAVTVSAEAPASPDEKGKKADDKKADDKKGTALEGGYTIVSGESGGKALPEGEVKGSIVKFTGDTIVGTDKDKKEFFASKYTLDTSKKPWAITMTSKGKDGKEMTAKGVIKKEGDTITIAYALPGGDTPTEFKTKEKQHLFVLKNMNKGDKDKGKGDKDKGDKGTEPNKFTKD